MMQHPCKIEYPTCTRQQIVAKVSCAHWLQLSQIVHQYSQTRLENLDFHHGQECNITDSTEAPL